MQNMNDFDKTILLVLSGGRWMPTSFIAASMPPDGLSFASMRKKVLGHLAKLERLGIVVSYRDGNGFVWRRIE